MYLVPEGPNCWMRASCGRRRRPWYAQHQSVNGVGETIHRNNVAIFPRRLRREFLHCEAERKDEYSALEECVTHPLRPAYGPMMTSAACENLDTA